MENIKDLGNSGSEAKKSATDTGVHGADAEEGNEISNGKSQASRNNGRKSNGPKTARGKSISRWNSMKHGAYAKTLLILEGKHLAEYADYKQLLQEILEELKPTRVEDKLAIEKLIMDTWRLRRSLKFELTETEKQHDGMVSLCMPNIQRYSAMVHRQWDKSHQQVCEVRQRTEQELDAAGQSATAPTAAHELAIAESAEEEQADDPQLAGGHEAIKYIATDQAELFADCDEDANLSLQGRKPATPERVDNDSAGEDFA